MLVGNYTVDLLDGWAMERLDASGSATVVEATVLDPSVFVEVVAGSISNARFRFETDGTIVDMTLGTIRVTIQVTEVEPPPAECDPLDQATCPAGEACYPIGGTGGAACEVVTIPGGAGDACTMIGECAPGLVCVFFGSTTGDTLCVEICDINDVGFCPGGAECFGLNFPSIPDVGVCVP